LAGGRFNLQSEEQVRFWKDIWLGDKPLCEAYPNLFRIIRKKDDTVANVVRTLPLNVSFRRGLANANMNSWYGLAPKLSRSILHQGWSIYQTFWKDFVSVELTKSGFFKVRSIYRTMIKQGVQPEENPLWKLKVPLKIKIFLWYLIKGVTLTKDN